MRVFLLSVFILLSCCVKSSAAIGVGIYDKDVLMWRFWEVKEGRAIPEMLVYNTGDTAISFTVRKVFVMDMAIDSSRRKWFEEECERYARDTVIHTVVIPAHQWQALVIGGERKDGRFDGVFINGRSAGIVSHEMQEPGKMLGYQYAYKYYSAEGMYGTPSFGLIGTSELISRRGGTHEMTLYFDFTDQHKWQSFSGINEMSATINDGLDAATVEVMGVVYRLTARERKLRIPARIDNTRPYTVKIAMRVAENEVFPSFDLHTFFQNGNGGVDLPVFVQ